MSGPVLAVSSSNAVTLAGVKRPFAGDAGSFPSWRPSKRGRAVEPPGSEVAVPGLSARDRPNRGSNVTIPYARVAPVQTHPHERGRIEPGDYVFVDIGADTPRPGDGDGSMLSPGCGLLRGEDVSGACGHSANPVYGIDHVNKLLSDARALGARGFSYEELHAIRRSTPSSGLRPALLRKHGYLSKDEASAFKDAMEVHQKKLRDAFASLDRDNRKVEVDGVERDLSVLHRMRLDGVMIGNDEAEARASSSDRQVVYNIAIAGRALANNGFATHDDYRQPWLERSVRARGGVSDMFLPHNDPYRLLAGQKQQVNIHSPGVGVYATTKTQMFDRHLQCGDVLYLGLFQANELLCTDKNHLAELRTRLGERNIPMGSHGRLYYKFFSGRWLSRMVVARKKVRKTVDFHRQTPGLDDNFHVDFYRTGGSAAAEAADTEAADTGDEPLDEGMNTGLMTNKRTRDADLDLFAKDAATENGVFKTIVSVEELESLVVAQRVGRVLDVAAVRTHDGATGAMVNVAIGKVQTAAELGVTVLNNNMDRRNKAETIFQRSVEDEKTNRQTAVNQLETRGKLSRTDMQTHERELAATHERELAASREAASREAASREAARQEAASREAASREDARQETAPDETRASSSSTQPGREWRQSAENTAAAQRDVDRQQADTANLVDSLHEVQHTLAGSTQLAQQRVVDALPGGDGTLWAKFNIYSNSGNNDGAKDVIEKLNSVARKLTDGTGNEGSVETIKTIASLVEQRKKDVAVKAWFTLMDDLLKESRAGQQPRPTQAREPSPVALPEPLSPGVTNEGAASVAGVGPSEPFSFSSSARGKKRPVKTSKQVKPSTHMRDELDL